MTTTRTAPASHGSLAAVAAAAEAAEAAAGGAVAAVVGVVEQGLCESCRRAPATATWAHPGAGAPFAVCAGCHPEAPTRPDAPARSRTDRVAGQRVPTVPDRRRTRR